MSLDENNIEWNSSNQEVCDFLDEALLTKCKVYYLGKRLHPLWTQVHPERPRNCYRVELKNPRGHASFEFYDSTTATERDDDISLYDFFACIVKEDVGDYIDFCANYGYDESKSSLSIYYAVRREYSKLKKLFLNNELEVLSEIFV